MTPNALLAACLSLACIAAQASEWSKLGTGEGAVVYLDKASIIKGDKSHRVWTMRSYSKARVTPDGKAYRSVKAMHTYACDERTTVLLAQVYYPDAMGKGEIVGNYKYEKFAPEDIIPDSPFDHALGAVCAP